MSLFLASPEFKLLLPVARRLLSNIGSCPSFAPAAMFAFVPVADASAEDMHCAVRPGPEYAPVTLLVIVSSRSF